MKRYEKLISCVGCGAIASGKDRDNMYPTTIKKLRSDLRVVFIDGTCLKPFNKGNYVGLCYGCRKIYEV